MVSTRTSPGDRRQPNEGAPSRIARQVWGPTARERSPPPRAAPELPSSPPPSPPPSPGSTTHDDHVSSSEDDEEDEELGRGQDDEVYSDEDDEEEEDEVHDEVPVTSGIFMCTSAGAKPILPPPPPVVEAKKLKIPTSVVNFTDAKAGKRAHDRMRQKAVALKNAYDVGRSDWMHHRSLYNQVLSSLFDRFKRTIVGTNSDMRKASTKIAKQETEISALKRKVEELKDSAKTRKKSAVEQQRALKARYEILIKDYKSDRNKMSTQIRRMEVKSREKQSKSKGKSSSNSLDEYAQKLRIKQMADEERYTMKIRLAEDKKDREKKARRDRQNELKSQIAISGGRFNGFTGNSNDRADRPQEGQDFMVSSYNLFYLNDNQLTNFLVDFFILNIILSR